MSDTLETDKEVNMSAWLGSGPLVHAEFARKLERERDEARIQYRSTLALAEALANTQIELKKERDELRADQINHENLSMRYMDERDEALAEAAKWEQLHDQDTDHLVFLQARDRIGPTETLNETAQRLQRERDEALAQMCQAVGYLSTIAEDCEGWLNNQCDETACEFIKAVRDYAKKGINA